ncbi:hypothetical protein J6590_103595 [Homalodisca vitripennis]|nr:hypothetical protein J6590_097887 [Homalodisca vitripennis]KAG8313938.1 hypothetical protein J6590_103595 [Homalodisca vitripennis]
MSSSEEDTRVSAEHSSKKHTKHGSIKNATKKLRDSNNETGPDCRCKRYKCFEHVTGGERTKLINDFNYMTDRNAQNSYLAGLITVHSVELRRPRNDVAIARLNDYSYSYKVRVLRDGKIVEVSVCYGGFLSIFGATDRRITTIKSSLSSTGVAPIDERGKHVNRDSTIRELLIFCDSCAGQNYNLTFIRYLHYMVTKKDRFDEVTVTFPIRGHSYMEPDKNIGLINKKAAVETPNE